MGRRPENVSLNLYIALDVKRKESGVFSLLMCFIISSNILLAQLQIGWDQVPGGYLFKSMLYVCPAT